MAINTSNWKFADWRSQKTAALRLAMARLHDGEVRQAAAEVGTGKARYQRLQPGYLEALSKEITKLETQCSIQSNAAGVLGSSKPIHLVPRL